MPKKIIEKEGNIKLSFTEISIFIIMKIFPDLYLVKGTLE